MGAALESAAMSLTVSRRRLVSTIEIVLEVRRKVEAGARPLHKKFKPPRKHFLEAPVAQPVDLWAESVGLVSLGRRFERAEGPGFKSRPGLHE